jgi:hypothetical protein
MAGWAKAALPPVHGLKHPRGHGKAVSTLHINSIKPGATVGWARHFAPTERPATYANNFGVMNQAPWAELRGPVVALETDAIQIGGEIRFVCLHLTTQREIME